MLEEHAEEHGGDEGLLSDVVNDQGKYTQKAVNAAIKDSKASGDSETLGIAQEALALVKAEATAKKATNEAQAALDRNTLKKYGELSEADVKTLVLDDKWTATIQERVLGVVNALTFELLARIQQIGERYAQTVGELDTELTELEAKVAAHLSSMGVEA